MIVVQMGWDGRSTMVQYSMDNVTISAMRLFAWLLAENMQRVAKGAGWLPQARAVLDAIDKLDVGGDEEHDRRLEELTRSDGPIWLGLAEKGFFDDTDHIGHVLWHFEAGGYPGTAFTQHLLRAIDAADADNRAAVAMGHPELVGLWRAVAEMRDGRSRLVAVMDRK